VSPDGFVLTSLFNVGGDVAFISKATGKPRAFDPHEPIQKMLVESADGVEQRPNAVKRITVTLPDGGRHEAKVIAKHEPLGVALLKIDAHDLAWYDVAGNSVCPAGPPPTRSTRASSPRPPATGATSSRPTPCSTTATPAARSSTGPATSSAWPRRPSSPTRSSAGSSPPNN
jgi:hypothetical protein